jgi:hypothetical protein
MRIAAWVCVIVLLIRRFFKEQSASPSKKRQESIRSNYIRTEETPSFESPNQRVEVEGPTSRRTIDRMTRVVRLGAAFLIILLGITLGWEAWRLYRDANPSYPAANFLGDIVFVVPNDLQSVEVSFHARTETNEGDPGYEHFPEVQSEVNNWGEVGVRFTTKHPLRGCLPWIVTASGNARVTVNSNDPNQISVGDSSVIRGEACREVGDGVNVLTADIIGDMQRGVGFVAGYRMAIRTPSISVFAAGAPILKGKLSKLANEGDLRPPETYPSDNPVAQVITKWSIDTSVDYPADPSQVSVNTGQAPDQSNLVWSSSGTSQTTSNMAMLQSSGGYSVTLTYLPGEATANRNLFIAGLLGGASVSMIPWAGQIYLDMFRRRKDDD